MHDPRLASLLVELQPRADNPVHAPCYEWRDTLYPTVDRTRVNAVERGVNGPCNSALDRHISVARANDIQTNTRLGHLQSDGKKPSAEHPQETGRSNSRMMAEDGIKERLGISRQTAEQTFKKPIRKFEASPPLKEREVKVLEVLGFSMMWEFALSDAVLWPDFVDLLAEEGALAGADRLGSDASRHL